MAKKNLAAVAKKNSITKKTSATRKSATKAVPQKPATEVDDKTLRDQKVQTTVQELLKDSPLIELDEISNEERTETEEVVVDNESVEWLKEQLGAQAQEIEGLRIELSNAKNEQTNVTNTVNDSDMRKTVVNVFNELQNNYLSMGFSPTGRPNFIINPLGFMNRMIEFFPYLVEHKKF